MIRLNCPKCNSWCVALCDYKGRGWYECKECGHVYKVGDSHESRKQDKSSSEYKD